jgi:BioD-like phosphotransacetylase family protein
MNPRAANYVHQRGVTQVGKTTTSLGLLAGFLERTSRVGFIKPVGQQHLLVDGIKVDKVAIDLRLQNERSHDRMVACAGRGVDEEVLLAPA